MVGQGKNPQVEHYKREKRRASVSSTSSLTLWKNIPEWEEWAMLQREARRLPLRNYSQKRGQTSWMWIQVCLWWGGVLEQRLAWPGHPGLLSALHLPPPAQIPLGWLLSTLQRASAGAFLTPMPTLAEHPWCEVAPTRCSWAQLAGAVQGQLLHSWCCWSWIQKTLAAIQPSKVISATIACWQDRGWGSACTQTALSDLTCLHFREKTTGYPIPLTLMVSKLQNDKPEKKWSVATLCLLRKKEILTGLILFCFILFHLALYFIGLFLTINFLYQAGGVAQVVKEPA
jgi:hypothetical protein